MHREVSDESDTPRIGLVLSSGGVRGVYAHTGFMQAIQGLEIPVCASVGSSAGALVGGFIASGTPREHWAATLAGITSRNFWTTDSLLRFIWKLSIVWYSGINPGTCLASRSPCTVVPVIAVRS